MAFNAILERNLLALSSCDAALSIKTGAVAASPDITFANSKNGFPVPAQSINGTPIPFHSKIDPIREGEKYLDAFEGGGYIVFLGLGAGYHIGEFLKKNEVSDILIIENNVRIFRSILEEIDLTSIIADPRVRIMIDEEPKTIAEHILKSYFPIIAGSLRTVSLGARVNIEKEYFQAVVSEMKTIINSIVDDYSVQAQFGRRWFTNTIRNLKRASVSTVSIPPIRKAIVTGAGPSLELQMEEVRALRKKAFLIATDTSLPALMAASMTPDLVISIDCQQISYHHFMSGFPENIPLVLDLASPPLISDMAKKVLFFSSGHPFSRFITRAWKYFPDIDTTGGNVSHAALSLAVALGAEEVYLAGIDFSYPFGKAYCRGTYIYPLFHGISTKLDPADDLFYTFVLNNKNLGKELIRGNIVYTTHQMLMYKQKLEQAISALQCNVYPLSGLGIPLSIDKRKRIAHSTEKPLFSQGPEEMNWKSFLEDYVRKISSLPEPTEPMSKYLYNLSFEEKELWITLLPLATWVKEYSGRKIFMQKELFSFTKEYAAEHIRRFID
jgi:hypothetical protein